MFCTTSSKFTFRSSRLGLKLLSPEEDRQQDQQPSRRVSAGSISNSKSHLLQSALSFRGIENVLKYFFFLPSSFHFFKFPRIIFGFRRGREKVLPNKKLRRKKLFKVCSNVQIRLFYNISSAKFWLTANCNWMNTNYELKL